MLLYIIAITLLISGPLVIRYFGSSHLGIHTKEDKQGAVTLLAVFSIFWFGSIPLFIVAVALFSIYWISMRIVG
jgi:hypothetical protein